MAQVCLRLADLYFFLSSRNVELNRAFGMTISYCGVTFPILDRRSAWISCRSTEEISDCYQVSRRSSNLASLNIGDFCEVAKAW